MEPARRARSRSDPRPAPSRPRPDSRTRAPLGPDLRSSPGPSVWSRPRSRGLLGGTRARPAGRTGHVDNYRDVDHPRSHGLHLLGRRRRADPGPGAARGPGHARPSRRLRPTHERPCRSAPAVNRHHRRGIAGERTNQPDPSSQCSRGTGHGVRAADPVARA